MRSLLLSLLLLSLLAVSVIVNADDFDENTLFLIEKINTYVKNEHSGNYTKALAGFDADGDGKLDSNELWYALKTIDVGTYMTRGIWVEGIMDHFKTVTAAASAAAASILLSDFLELTLAM